jgi:hypothetical protein
MALAYVGMKQTGFTPSGWLSECRKFDICPYFACFGGSEYLVTSEMPRDLYSLFAQHFSEIVLELLRRRIVRSMSPAEKLTAEKLNISVH